MRPKGGIPVFSVCLAVTLSAFLLFAQSEKDSKGQKIPQHDAAAIIKLVTVRVLDQEGRPVTDLRKEDFVLYDNGERKVITEFEVHTLSEEGMRVRQAGEAADLAKSVEGMNRRLLIFLDIQGSGVIGMANAKKAALHFVETQLRPGDEVGILGFSYMRGFFIKEYLTTDHEKIHKAIKKTRELPPSGGFASGGGLDDSIRTRGESGGGSGGNTGVRGSTSGAITPFASGGSSIAVPGTAVFQHLDFIPRMYDFAQALKLIPGNKSLILFSSRNLGPYAVRLGKEFGSANTPVYTVNTRNWIQKRLMTISIKKKYIWTNHPLQEISLASGGKYFADIKDIETFSSDVQALTGDFYVLGYYVKESWDGEYHEIKVAVNRPGLQVLAQNGYFNPKPFAELTDFEKQLHLNDLVFAERNASSDSRDIPVEALLIAGQKKVNCVLLSKIDVDDKIGVPPALCEIYAFIFNKKQKAVVKKRGEMDFSKSEHQTFFPYFLAKLRAGDYECLVVARDLETGQSAVGKFRFRFPKKSASDIILSSPLLFCSGAESRMLKFSDKEVSISDFYRFLPKNHTLLVRELGPEDKNLLAVLPITFQEGLASEVEIGVRLHPKPKGKPIDISTEIRDVQKTKTTTDFLMIEIRLPDMKPGEYELEIEAIDKNTSARFSIRKSLTRR
jgi:VWFA-related protein